MSHRARRCGRFDRHRIPDFIGGQLQRYVINLDRSRDRMKSFDRQAEKLGLTFTRVPAIDGRGLSEMVLREYHTRCPSDRTISFGELGCFLSHVKVWSEIVTGRHKWSFVAEDDLHFTGDAKSFLETDTWLPEHVHIVKAETMMTAVRMSSYVLDTPFKHELRLLRSFHGGTAGYFLSLEGAAKLLAFANLRCEPTDHFIFEFACAAEQGLTIAQICPAIAIQDDLAESGSNLVSDLDQDRETFWNSHPLSRKPRGLRRIGREIKRLGRKLFGHIQRLAVSAKGEDIFQKVPFGPYGGSEHRPGV